MAIQGFCPPPSHSPYYQLLERGSARLGRVKNFIRFNAVNMGSVCQRAAKLLASY